MKPTSKESADYRTDDRRSLPGEHGAEEDEGAVLGDGRVKENRGVGAAMVDALEDILRWERASERSMKVAQKVTPDPAP